MKNKKRQGRSSLTFFIFLFSLFICFASCEQITAPVHSHQWGEWTQTTAPTCTTAGTETRVCRLNVKHTGTRAVAPIGHEWGEWTQTKAPTQTLDGEETRICIHNSEHKETRTGAAALNHIHQWGEWARATDPTCTTTGKETRMCLLNTAHTETRTAGAAHGHDYIYTVTTPVTCITAGEEAGICAHDATHTVTRVIAIDPDAHIYQWVTIPSSFIGEGIEKEVCTLCSHESGNTRDLGPLLLITTTEEWDSALAQLNGKTGSYTLIIDGDFAIDGTTTASFGTTAVGSLTVTLKGSGTLSLNSNGSIVRVGPNQTLIIDSEDLTLEGQPGNNASLVYVSGLNANLELRNGTLFDNTADYGGGVYVSYFATFSMSGGVIFGNTAPNGGGVCVHGGNFTMTGGEISGNTASYGGGVYVANGSTFRIVTGTVYGSDGGASSNTATGSSTSGAALYGTAQHGTFSEETWNSKGTLSATNNTIWVDNGDLGDNISINAPVWREGNTITLTAPILWLTMTITEGWQISDNGASWSDFTSSIADMSHNGKYLRYYATSVSGATFYSFAVIIRVLSATTWAVTIDMYDSYGDGWDGNGALRITINGVDIATGVKVQVTATNNTPSGQRSTNTYTFMVNMGEVVQLYWVAGSAQGENSFIAYYSDIPPSPAFTISNNNTWSGTNALVYRLRGTMNSIAGGTLLGEFTVP